MKIGHKVIHVKPIHLVYFLSRKHCFKGYFKISLHTLKQMSKRYIEKPKQTYGFTVVSNILVYLKLLSLFARIVFNV